MASEGLIMRMLTIFTAALTLSSCASAVNDSLARRGLDARTIHVERVKEARNDAAAARTSIDRAVGALAAIDGLDGPALARQAALVKAAGETAALAAQDLRLSGDTVKTSGARFFTASANEIALMAPAEREAASAKLAAADEAHRAFVGALDTAALRLSPALSLYDGEATALRKSPTSLAAADARKPQRAGARNAATEAGAALDDAVAAGDRYLAALN